jgi:hypothetical protein
VSHPTKLLVAVVGLAVALGACGDDGGSGSADGTGTTVGAAGVEDFAWTEVTGSAPWEPRAGLHAVELGGRFLLMGGRTPNDSDIPGDSVIWSDVWASDDEGASWEEVLATGGADHWAPRAYFQAVELDGYVYVLGGQDFAVIDNPGCAFVEGPCPPQVSVSQFFNDVWRSTDGVEWEQMTEAAPWEGRAGLRAVVFDEQLWIFGGSTNDDSAIVGPGGPQRIYFNDVWRSTDGAEWELVTDDAPWEPRAGAVVVAKDDAMYLLGGEDGFTCTPLPDCEPPYFNDVWRSTDGADWELVTENAGWSPRPGHQCAVVDDQFVCFGGFGLIENPVDVWVSEDGETWSELADPPWQAAGPEEVKYDFEAFAVSGPDAIYTFGGDRETFDFDDPENYLRVDDDVWRFGPGS